MRLHPGQASRFPTEAEVTWCREHPEVPEAAAVLRFFGEAVVQTADARLQAVFGGPVSRLAGEGAGADDDTLAEATVRLRAIQPRPMARVDRFYAYVTSNPQTRCEGLKLFS